MHPTVVERPSNRSLIAVVTTA